MQAAIVKDSLLAMEVAADSTTTTTMGWTLRARAKAASTVCFLRDPNCCLARASLAHGSS
jgi:hypothetical protein